jgi:hypothetical protein
LRSSEEIALCVQRLCRGTEVMESLRIREKKLRRNNVLIRAGEDSSCELAEERRQRSRPLRHLKFFQVWKKSAKAQEEQ